MKDIFKNKTILITGGTGTFGKNFVKYVLDNFKPKKLIIFSRDELKQFEMQKSVLFGNNKVLRYFIGDIRDVERLKIAMNGVDIVVHAAALKHVAAAEYNPSEFIKTNIQGSENIVIASIYNKVKNVIALSTDKAVQPINLYGATKLVSEKIFISANNMYGDKITKFSVTRYGNVLGSRGSIITIFDNLLKKNIHTLPVTDKKMTRFWITKEQAVKFVKNNIEIMEGGEIFVPKLPSVRIVDLAKSMAKKIEIKIIGKGIGEKLHEVMCVTEENDCTIEYPDHYTIIGSDNVSKLKKKNFKNKAGQVGKKVKSGFSYTSENNKHFLNISEISIMNKLNSQNDTL